MKLTTLLVLFGVIYSNCIIESPVLVLGISADTYKEVIKGVGTDENSFQIGRKAEPVPFSAYEDIAGCKVTKKVTLIKDNPRVIAYHIHSNTANTHKVNVIFGIRGTATVGDIYQDAKFFFGYAPSGYLESSIKAITKHIQQCKQEYLNPVQKTNLKHNHQNSGNSAFKLEFSTMGHSLGAIVAQSLGFYLGVKSYSVESFGLSKAMDSIMAQDFAFSHRELLKNKEIDHSLDTDEGPRLTEKRKLVTLPQNIGKASSDFKKYLQTHATEYFPLPTEMNLNFQRETSKKYIIYAEQSKKCSLYHNFFKTFNFEEIANQKWFYWNNHLLKRMLNTVFSSPANYKNSYMQVKNLKAQKILLSNLYSPFRATLFGCYTKFTKNRSNNTHESFFDRFRKSLETFDNAILSKHGKKGFEEKIVKEIQETNGDLIGEDFLDTDEFSEGNTRNRSVAQYNSLKPAIPRR